MISLNSTVVAVQDQVSADLGGEVAILQLGSGVYYGLDEVGARIWSLIQEPRRVSQVRDILLAEYEVEGDRCQRDVLALFEHLLAHELIQIKDETTP